MPTNNVYKYIHFVCVGDTGKTKRYSIRNNRNHAELAIIVWYGQWREYVVQTKDGMIFNKGCLDDIADFLMQLKKERTKNDYICRGGPAGNGVEEPGTAEILRAHGKSGP